MESVFDFVAKIKRSVNANWFCVGSGNEFARVLDRMYRLSINPACTCIQGLAFSRESVILNTKSLFAGKADRSHRVKTYMLVTAYQGFRVCVPPSWNNQGAKLLRQLSYYCRARKFNALGIASHSWRKQYNDFIKTQSKYTWPAPGAGKFTKKQWFWYSDI